MWLRIVLFWFVCVTLCACLDVRRARSGGSPLASQRRVRSRDYSVHLINRPERRLASVQGRNRGLFLARIQRAPPKQPSLQPLYDFLVSNGLNNLCKMIKQADIEDVLLSVGSFTLFAPADECFAFLPGSLWESFRKDKEKKRQFIMHHVVPGTVSSANIQNDALVDVAQGPSVRFNLYRGGKVWTVSGAQVIRPDLRLGSYTVHVVDHFLYPPATMNNLDYIRANHDNFYRMLATADPNNHITEGTFTIFVPGDDAFKALPDFLQEAIFTNNSILQSVLLNHIVPSTYYRVGLPLRGNLTSLDEKTLRFTTRRGLVLVNGVPIIQPDISVTNGVIHIITRVLLPPNIFEDCNCVPTTTRKPTTVSPTTNPDAETITNFQRTTIMLKKRVRVPTKIPKRTTDITPKATDTTTPTTVETTPLTTEVPSTTVSNFRRRRPSFAPLTLPTFESSRIKSNNKSPNQEPTSPLPTEQSDPLCISGQDCPENDNESETVPEPNETSTSNTLDNSPGTCDDNNDCQDQTTKEASITPSPDPDQNSQPPQQDEPECQNGESCTAETSPPGETTKPAKEPTVSCSDGGDCKDEIENSNAICSPGQFCPQTPEDSVEKADPSCVGEQECTPKPFIKDESPGSLCPVGTFCPDSKLDSDKSKLDAPKLPQNDCEGTTCSPAPSTEKNKPSFIPGRRRKPSRKPPGFIRIPYGPLLPRPKPTPSSTTSVEGNTLVTSPDVLIISPASVNIPPGPESRPQLILSTTPNEQTVATTESSENPFQTTPKATYTSGPVSDPSFESSQPTDRTIPKSTEDTKTFTDFVPDVTEKPETSSQPTTTETKVSSNTYPSVTQETTQSTPTSSRLDTTSKLSTQPPTVSTPFETKGPFDFFDEDPLTTVPSITPDEPKSDTERTAPATSSEPTATSGTSSDKPSSKPTDAEPTKETVPSKSTPPNMQPNTESTNDKPSSQTEDEETEGYQETQQPTEFSNQPYYPEHDSPQSTQALDDKTSDVPKSEGTTLKIDKPQPTTSEKYNSLQTTQTDKLPETTTKSESDETTKIGNTPITSSTQQVTLVTDAQTKPEQATPESTPKSTDDSSDPSKSDETTLKTDITGTTPRSTSPNTEPQQSTDGTTYKTDPQETTLISMSPVTEPKEITDKTTPKTVTPETTPNLSSPVTEPRKSTDETTSKTDPQETTPKTSSLVTEPQLSTERTTPTTDTPKPSNPITEPQQTIGETTPRTDETTPRTSSKVTEPQQSMKGSSPNINELESTLKPYSPTEPQQSTDGSTRNTDLSRSTQKPSSATEPQQSTEGSTANTDLPEITPKLSSATEPEESTDGTTPKVTVKPTSEITEDHQQSTDAETTTTRQETTTIPIKSRKKLSTPRTTFDDPTTVSEDQSTSTDKTTLPSETPTSIPKVSSATSFDATVSQTDSETKNPTPEAFPETDNTLGNTDKTTQADSATSEIDVPVSGPTNPVDEKGNPLNDEPHVSDELTTSRTESPITTEKPQPTSSTTQVTTKNQTIPTRPTILVIPYVTTPKSDEEPTTSKPYVTTPKSDEEPTTPKPKPKYTTKPPKTTLSVTTTDVPEDYRYTDSTQTTISPQPEYQAPIPEVEPLMPVAVDSKGQPPTSIEDVLNRPDLVIGKTPVTFNIVLKLFSNVGLTDILLRKGPYTLCVPTDAAFGLLPQDYLQRLQGNGDLLRKVLLHHVITTQIPVNNLKNNFVIRTYQGLPVIINVLDAGKVVLIGGSRVLGTTRTRNGVIYITNRVFSELPQYNLLRALRTHPELGHFYDYVINSPLKQVLRARGPFTLVAPTNDAFNQLSPDVLNMLATNQTALEKILYNHLATGAYFSRGIHNGLVLPTPRGGTLRFTVTSSGLEVNDARVLQADISSGNGVLHVVDQVLLSSPDIFERLGYEQHQNHPQPTSSYLSLSDVSRGLGVDTFVKWMETSGLLQKITDGERYTVLAPTEDAIQALPPTTLQSLQQNPNMLQNILKYHVVQGFLQPTAIGNEDTIPSLLPGRNVRFNWYRNETELTVCGARLGLDRRRDNVVIQVINKVLYPPTGDIISTISKSPLLRDLTKALKLTGLDITLSNVYTPYTLFAPTDDAFKRLPAPEYEKLFKDPEEMKQLLNRHLSAGTLFSIGVTNGMKIPSQSGDAIVITTKPQCIVVDGVNVLYSDITATNGVVHVLNHLL